MIDAVEAVRERLLRAVRALEASNLPYAVAGGNAVAAWVARVDRAAVRNTQDVDILIRREDFEQVKAALEEAGFVHRRSLGLDMFLDGPGAPPRDAVHILYAGEKVRESNPTVAAEITTVDADGDFRIVALEALAHMKLNAFRDKDRMHLRDMLSIGLIDATWLPRLIPEHAAKLKLLIDDPEG